MADDVGMREPRLVPRKSREELRKFVDDFVSGRIFSSAHLPPTDDRLIGGVFLTAGLGGFSEWTLEELQQIGIIYEYLNQAGPRSINGYPCFFSLRVLHVEDWRIALVAINAELERRKSIPLPGDAP